MTRFTPILTTLLLLTGIFGSLARTVDAEEPAEVALKPGTFPPANSGTYLAGELVIVDPMNRRGSLRLDGNGPGDRYHAGPLHAFAMLPYGMVWYQGAPAELRDIPAGTHVHGTFFAPPVGDEATIPPLPADQKQYEVKQNHALLIEDDFSYYQRRGRSWKVVSLNIEKGKIDVVPVGEATPNGINEPYTFDIDHVTRVWKERRLVDLDQIVPDQIVQLNLAWSPGWRDMEFTVSDLWLDEESRAFATELQRRRHVRYEKQRWLPGWIDSVEHFDYGGGIVTITLFGGMDPSLYEDLKNSQAEGFGVASTEKTLRTWFHRADKKIGQVVEWKETPNPPLGSSGIQVKLKFTELLEGYRPGNCVRVKSINWIFVTMPPEERIKSSEDQQRSAIFSLP
jgi:hypothetical protein